MSLVDHPSETIAAKRIAMTKSDPGSRYIEVAKPRLIAKVALFTSMWISYYSSHEGKTSVDLATIRLKN